MGVQKELLAWQSSMEQNKFPSRKLVPLICFLEGKSFCSLLDCHVEDHQLSARDKTIPPQDSWKVCLKAHGSGRGRDLFRVAFLFSLKFLKFRLEELQGKQKSHTKGSYWLYHDLFRCQTLPKIVSSILYYCRL